MFSHMNGRRDGAIARAPVLPRVAACTATLNRGSSLAWGSLWPLGHVSHIELEGVEGRFLLARHASDQGFNLIDLGSAVRREALPPHQPRVTSWATAQTRKPSMYLRMRLTGTCRYILLPHELSNSVARPLKPYPVTGSLGVRHSAYRRAVCDCTLSRDRAIQMKVSRHKLIFEED